MKRLTILLAVMAVFLWVGGAVAMPTVVSFGDSANYWPGWANGEDDSKDTVGTPDFSGGQATFSGNLLTSLTFDNGTSADDLWSILSPGDLFLDVQSNGIWDYVVDITTWTVPGPGTTDADPIMGSYEIYSISENLGSPSTSSNYIRSGADNAGEWAGYGIRDNHPVAYNVGSSISAGQIGFSGWGDLPATTYTFDFANLVEGGLLIPGDLTIGWAMNCANEVIYEKVPNPVPEPATMLLFGTGLIGMAAIGRKKFLKRG